MPSKRKKNPYQVDYYNKARGGVVVLPNVVLESKRYCTLNPQSKVILNYIASQYNGYNNGDLCATLSVFKKYNFTSNDTISRSLKQLENNGLIFKTRVGGKDWRTGGNLPSLYAITWQPIDECKGKLDVDPTTKPLVNFLEESRLRA
ncbi:hypothetical protein AAEU29_01630 [Pseudoalteromonas sp. SSM20]|uniref:hypothetical protein n=1 Tax=Pseudoalteromonas sp. SSM20 TaxID=3139394 RepID=UPI003BAC2C4B